MPLTQAKQWEICALCDTMVMLPPGRVYRGEYYHKRCASWVAQRDYSEEVYAPLSDQVQEEVLEILEGTP